MERARCGREAEQEYADARQQRHFRCRQKKRYGRMATRTKEFRVGPVPGLFLLLREPGMCEKLARAIRARGKGYVPSVPRLRLKDRPQARVRVGAVEQRCCAVFSEHGRLPKKWSTAAKSARFSLSCAAPPVPLAVSSPLISLVGGLVPGGNRHLPRHRGGEDAFQGLGERAFERDS